MKQLLLVAICLLIHSLHSNALRMLRRNNRIRPPTGNKNVLLSSFDTFDQKLDHATPLVNTTWKQRFSVDDKFFKNDTQSPVFIMVSGVGPANLQDMADESWTNYAEKYGALCFLLEHRYYGESQPTPDFSTENLQYLSSEQALADLAYFIESMNTKYGLTSKNKWIAFGGFYGGSLAAWLRLKYPHLVFGAVSSSAPLLAQVDFFGYFDAAKASLDTYNAGCSDIITEATNQLQKMLQKANGSLEISNYIKLCSDIDVENSNDITTLFGGLSDIIAHAVQYNSNGPDSQIDKICKILADETIGTPLQRYAEVVKEMNDQDCVVGKYTDLISQLSSGTNISERLWVYQTCTEFGFYATSGNNSSLFGTTIDVTYFEGLCTDVFGQIFNPTQLEVDVHRTNNNYGGLDIFVTNVLFVHGSIDPWYLLGITASNNPDAPSIFINGTSHCADMGSETPNDPPQLKEARSNIDELIGQWLEE